VSVSFASATLARQPLWRLGDRYRPILRRGAIALTVVMLGIGVALLYAVAASRPASFLGTDIHQYLRATERWLGSGTPYLASEVAGPFDYGHDTFLHPPIALLLFAPFLVLPLPLWWVIPLVAIGWSVWSWRPAWWCWPILALAVAWPRFHGALLVGNTDLWVCAGVALGLRFGWPALIAIAKPTLFPMLLAGIGHRSWWLGVVLAAALCVPFGMLWLDWIRVVENSPGNFTYGLPNMLWIGALVVAWKARDRSSPAPRLELSRRGREALASLGSAWRARSTRIPVRPRSAFGGIGIGLAIAVLVMLTRSGNPVDAGCYYSFDAADPWNRDGCFLYSPPVEMLMVAVRSVMPFEAFTFLLRSAELLVLGLVAGPALPFALFVPSVAIELNAANINLLVVGAVLIGFRAPWMWAFIALTKVTPGVGMLWFAVRREWRSFLLATGATAAIVALSWIASPHLWDAYITSLRGEPDASVWQIWWRLPMAAIVVVWGARGNHRWALMVAVFIAMPRWYFLSPVVLVGLFALVRLPRPLPWPRLAPIARRFGSPVPQPAAATSDGRTVRAPSS
jgi:hypothetical protein